MPQASCSRTVSGDINSRPAGVPAEKHRHRGNAAVPPGVGHPAYGYLLNVFAIIPCTSADALTTRAMLAGWYVISPRPSLGPPLQLFGSIESLICLIRFSTFFRTWSGSVVGAEYRPGTPTNPPPSGVTRSPM